MFIKMVIGELKMSKKYFKLAVSIGCILGISYAGTIKSQGTAGASKLPKLFTKLSYLPPPPIEPN